MKWGKGSFKVSYLKMKYIGPLFLLLIGCHSQINKSYVNVETFGDSLRIETKVEDGYFVKRYTDLKGVSDDGFDSSYEVYLKYVEKKNRKEVHGNYRFELNGFIFSFNDQDILKFCEKRIRKASKPDFGDTEEERISKTFSLTFGNFEDIVEGNQDLSTLHEMYQDIWKIEMITNCKFSMKESNGDLNPKSLLIEYYETSFSGGRNFYLLTENKDTVEFYFHNDWIE